MESYFNLPFIEFNSDVGRAPMSDQRWLYSNNQRAGFISQTSGCSHGKRSDLVGWTSICTQVGYVQRLKEDGNSPSISRPSCSGTIRAVPETNLPPPPGGRQLKFAPSPVPEIWASTIATSALDEGFPSRSDAFCWQFSWWPENSSFLVQLAYTLHSALAASRLCAIQIYYWH